MSEARGISPVLNWSVFIYVWMKRLNCTVFNFSFCDQPVCFFLEWSFKMCNKATFAVTAFDSDNVSHWGKPFSYIPMWFYLIGELNRFPLMEKDVARTRFRLGNNKEGNNPTQVVEEISGASISLLISYIQPITISQVRILGFDFE